MPQRTANVVLTYSVDKSAIAQAQAANQQAADSYVSIAEQIKALNLSEKELAQVNAQLGTSFTANVAAGAKVATAALSQATVAAEKLAATNKTSGGGSSGLLNAGASQAFLQTLGQIQQQEAGITGLLGQQAQAAATVFDFTEQLAAIQAGEAANQTQITTQMEAQGAIAQRLADAALARESAESGFVADLRSEMSAGGGGAGAADAGGDSGGGTSLGGLRSGLRAGGFLLGAEAGGGALRAAGQAITLDSAFGPLGLVMGVTLGVVHALSDAFNDAKTKAGEYLTAQVDINRLILGGATTDELKKKRDDLVNDQKAQQGVIDQANANLTAFADTFKQFASPEVLQKREALRQQLINETGVDPTMGLTGFGAIQSQLGDMQTAADKLTPSIQDANTAITSGAGAAGDLALKMGELKKATEEANKGIIAQYDQQANTQTRLAELRRNGTSDQIKEELAANKDRETIIQTYLLPNIKKLGESSDAVREKVAALNTEFTDLTGTDQQLLNSVLPIVAAREAEAKAIQDQKDASDALNQTLQDINKTQVDLANAADKTNDAYKALQQTTTDHNAKLEDIQAQYQTAQQSALMKKNDQLLKIDQQAAERALEQRENDNFSILQAVARGDIASAQATLAQQRIRDTQAQRQVQQQKDDTQKAYDDQLKAAQDQHAKLLDSENARYAKEFQQATDAHNKAVQEEYSTLLRLQELRSQEAFQAIYYANTVSGAAHAASNGVAVLSNALTSLANTFISTAQQMSSQVSGMSGGSALGSSTRYPTLASHQYTTGSAFVNAQLSSFYAQYAGTGGSGSRGFSATPYASGTDFVPQDMLAFIHRGERIIPASENNGMSGSVTVNVDARGSTIPQAQWEEWSERTATRTVQALTDRNNRVNRKGS